MTPLKLFSDLIISAKKGLTRFKHFWTIPKTKPNRPELSCLEPVWS